ncbi:MAG: hypothetical protein DWQ37_17810 [Planctomycetota bacterium]|nr:MAG: hypothetical protein DWQ37_17810 [Planctomycetota bacterium]
MADEDVRWRIVGDLIDVLRLQAKQIEKLVTHVEQVTTRLPEAHQFSVVVSELSELEVRWKTAAAELEKNR